MPAALEEALGQRGSYLHLPQAAFAVIADHLIDAVKAADRAASAELEQTLRHYITAALKEAPENVRRAVLGKSANQCDEAAARNFGQLAFAHLIAAQVALKNPPETFQKYLGDRTYMPYITELAKNALSSSELAKAVNRQPETVSRKLKDLRGAGITDYRREGVRIVNFLTPAARQSLQKYAYVESAKSVMSPVVARELEKKKNTVEEYWRAQLTFAVHSEENA